MSATRMTGTAACFAGGARGGHRRAGVATHAGVERAVGVRADEPEQAWAEDEWKDAKGAPWVPPTRSTSRRVRPPHSRTGCCSRPPSARRMTRSPPPASPSCRRCRVDDCRHAQRHAPRPAAARRHDQAVDVAPAASILAGTPQPIGKKGYFSVPLRGLTVGRAAVSVSSPAARRTSRTSSCCRRSTGTSRATAGCIGDGVVRQHLRPVQSQQLGARVEPRAQEAHRRAAGAEWVRGQPNLQQRPLRRGGAGANVGFAAKVSGQPHRPRSTSSICT